MTFSYLNLKFYYGLIGYLTGQFGEATATMQDGSTQTVQVFGVSPWLLWGTILLWSAISYLLGSVNFALVISKRKYHEDIREYGSGNAGTTNMLRVYGKKAALSAFVGDLLKGVLAAGLGLLFAGQTCGYIAGFACILGHCFPVWYHFKGGKGVATTLGVITVLEPVVGILCLLVFIGVVAFSRYVSLGSVMAAIVYPMLLNGCISVLYGTLLAAEAPEAAIFALPRLFSILIMLVIVARHWENIKRLYRGEESKMDFSSLKKKKAGEESAEK